jgi:hypothetical protein
VGRRERIGERMTKFEGERRGGEIVLRLNF